MIATIHDIPTTIPTMAAQCLPYINQVNSDWFINARIAGIAFFCIGIAIGATFGYFFAKGKYGSK